MMLKRGAYNVHPVVSCSKPKQFRERDLGFWLNIFLRNASNLLGADLAAAFIVQSNALARSLQFAICPSTNH